MRIKVLLSKEVNKALDINLHLENPSRKKVASILQELNEYFMSALPKDKLKNVTNPISDKTDVKRYDLNGIEKEQRLEIKNIIKYANRDNFFVFFGEDDRINAVVNDYVIIKILNVDKLSNINDLLKLSFYVLQFNTEDIEENIKLPYARRAAREDSPEVERREHLSWRQAKLDTLYKDFEQQIKYYNLNEQRDIQKREEKRGSVENISQNTVKVSTFKLGTKFTLERRSGAAVYEIKSIIPSNTANGSFDIEYEVNGNTHKATVNDEMVAYLYTPQFEESDVDDKYEIFIPKNINWKSIIDSAQTFPLNIFPSNMDRSVINQLKTLWDKMIAIVKEDDLEVQKTRSIEGFIERVSKENYRGTSNLFYIDKSGYRVNLSKYFDRLLEVPAKVPAAVIKAYEVGYQYIESKTNDLVELIQKEVKEENWSEVRRLSAILSDYGTKQFNEQTKIYLDEKKYDRKDSGSISKKEAVTNIERFISYFNKEVEKIDE